MQDLDELWHSQGFFVLVSITFNENDLIRYRLRSCQLGFGE
jgi:hypothetical protein